RGAGTPALTRWEVNASRFAPAHFRASAEMRIPQAEFQTGGKARKRAFPDSRKRESQLRD
ncbi:hypothetical protein, partial [Streptacidiphilus sp. EB129]|uniref:hypothetical protein n=1 Tax=Streptacidiphilus sp. EB129 TaxID=3156262 RepID=UPI0035179557